MTEIERKALALVNEVSDGFHDVTSIYSIHTAKALRAALCYAIEQHEAFRQEVSDAVAYLTGAVDRMASQPDEKYRQTIANDIRAIFAHFIIAKPDPMDLVADDMMLGAYNPRREWGAELRAAIEKRGGKIVWGEG